MFGGRLDLDVKKYYHAAISSDTVMCFIEMVPSEKDNKTPPIKNLL